MNELNLIQTISSKQILHSTYYDVMDSEQRDRVFNAYDYNEKKQVYELKRPELLNEGIIKTLIAYNGF
jgi:carbonic anhydrase